MVNFQGYVISEQDLYLNESTYDPRANTMTHRRRLDEYSSESACTAALPEAQARLEREYRNSARFFKLSCRSKNR
jgi:hypothetical protein